MFLFSLILDRCSSLYDQKTLPVHCEWVKQRDVCPLIIASLNYGYGPAKSRPVDSLSLDSKHNMTAKKIILSLILSWTT